MDKLTREDCLLLLRHAAEQTPDRFPRRSDFSEEEVVAIKAYLGPWPRALEAAGLKEPRSESRLEKNRERRIRAKRNRRLEAEAIKNSTPNQEDPS